MPSGEQVERLSEVGEEVDRGRGAAGEVTGADTIEGAAKRTAEEIGAQLREAAEEQGWI